MVGRWHQHCGWGVCFLVGLGGFESLGRDGGEGDAVGEIADAGADTRARVSKPPRTRNEVERWLRRGSGAWEDIGLWRCKGWGTSGSQTPPKTGSLRGRQTLSGAWAGTAHTTGAGYGGQHAGMDRPAV